MSKYPFPYNAGETIDSLRWTTPGCITHSLFCLAFSGFVGGAIYFFYQLAAGYRMLEATISPLNITCNSIIEPCSIRHEGVSPYELENATIGAGFVDPLICETQRNSTCGNYSAGVIMSSLAGIVFVAWTSALFYCLCCLRDNSNPHGFFYCGKQCSKPADNASVAETSQSNDNGEGYVRIKDGAGDSRMVLTEMAVVTAVNDEKLSGSSKF